MKRSLEFQARIDHLVRVLECNDHEDLAYYADEIAEILKANTTDCDCIVKAKDDLDTQKPPTRADGLCVENTS